MKLSIFALLMITAQLTLAKGVDLSFFEISKNTTTLYGQDSDEDDIDFDGLAFKFHWEFTDETILRMSKSNVSEDFSDEFSYGSFELIKESIGIGFARRDREGTIYSFLDYSTYDYLDKETFCFSSSCESFTEKGSYVDGVYDIGIGYKYAPSDNVNLDIEVSHVRWDWEGSVDTMAMTRLFLSAFVSLGIPVDFGVSYSKLDRLGEETTVGIKYTF